MSTQENRAVIDELKRQFETLTDPSATVHGDSDRVNAVREVLKELRSAKLTAHDGRVFHPVDALFSFSDESEHLFDQKNRWYRVEARDSGAELEFQCNYGFARMIADLVNSRAPRVYLSVFGIGLVELEEVRRLRIYPIENWSGGLSANR